MPKLYVSPGACSMSCHLAFEESKLKFEPMIGKWEEVTQLNPMHAVPVLVLDDGKVLTQNIAILTYVAEQATGANLLPKPGTFERAQTYQWLAWVSSDLHKTFGPLFNDELPEAERKEVEQSVHHLLEIVDKHMESKQFVAANQFTVADCFLFTIYGWTKPLEISTDKYRNMNAYCARLFERPAFQAVLKREGMLK